VIDALGNPLTLGDPSSLAGVDAFVEGGDEVQVLLAACRPGPGEPPPPPPGENE
jgi:hypothetical protein